MALSLAGIQGLSGTSSAVPVPPTSCVPQATRPLGVALAVAKATRIVDEMTLREKVAFIGLSPVPTQRIQQANPGVPRLCIPRLTLRDGPMGLTAARGVTAFPSEINLAATFDPALAQRFGSYLGAEARGQGVMGIQGPGLDVSVFDNWGRGFENLGEDPTLTSQLGAAMVTGIEGADVIAVAKHLGTYVQETARDTVDYLVSQRAREEVYLAPFRAAVRAGASSMMCSIGRTNGMENCSSAQNVTELAQLGFRGFVRTDAGASHDEVAALKSGVDLFVPYNPAPVLAAVSNGTLPLAVLNRAVRDVLTEMYLHGDTNWPGITNAGRRVSTAGSVSTSLAIAAQSMVLLKNDGILPLSLRQGGSLAVIGAAAQQDPILSGTGSSQVSDLQPVTDLAGIAAAAEPQSVTYTPAAPASGAGALSVGAASAIPSIPGYVEAPLALPSADSGLVDFSYASTTPVRLIVDGATVLENPATTSGRPVTFERAIELAAASHDVTVQWPATLPAPVVSAQPVDDLLAQAAAAARSAQTAIVVVGARDGEGYDPSSLSLPGYQDQLVEAVAAANPRTVVVVHSGGPVLMPWLSSVAGVVEAWYPGQVAGTALAQVLGGAVDPSGRLPVAFPTADSAAPMIPADVWPDPPTLTDLVSLGDLSVGSRWYAAHGVAPLFPFGYGQSYTTFAVSAPTVRLAGGSVEVGFDVTNSGTTAGRYVALLDVTYPPGSGEPPDELKGFTSVELAPRETTSMRVVLPLSSLEVYEGGWRLLAGRYTLRVGGRSVTLHLLDGQT